MVEQMHYRYYAILLLSITASLTACGKDEIEYRGILQNRPVGTAGVWVIDDVPYRANYNTVVTEKHGPLGIGACIGIAMSRGIVTQIESENPDACNRRLPKPEKR
jgi:hypothetical protein